jgi:hypothetical protein
MQIRFVRFWIFLDCGVISVKLGCTKVKEAARGGKLKWIEAIGV